jgi:IstB-like ATP binding protein
MSRNRRAGRRDDAQFAESRQITRHNPEGYICRLHSNSSTPLHVTIFSISSKNTTIADSSPAKSPSTKWHDLIGDSTYADAILDHIAHNAHRINLTSHGPRRLRTGKASIE